MQKYVNGTYVVLSSEEETAYLQTLENERLANISEDENLIRQKRNELLAETDWTGMSDVTMSAAMTTYRQALRDITDHANFPYLQEADWPTKPE